ncbi:MAG: LLM class flavin-dependent oxidoreductase, partial [Dehalococcoidaceae bacterium]|nr:LLM class flavin-dependent oxidoreductase [Dehalococcoidaceae bacterium]
MRFSYYLNPQTIEPEDDQRIINEMLDHTEFAINNGFTDIWITDHNFTGYSAFSDAIIMAGAVTQRFPGTHIGFALNVVPLMHPIRFVTQMNL